jgi:hypothetical protein
MNVFNRVVAVLILLGLVAILALGILQPGPTIDLLRRGLDGLLAFSMANLYLYIGIAAVLLFLALFVIILELRRPYRTTVTVRQAGGSVVELTTESVARSLEYHMGQIAGVQQVHPDVVSTGNAVKLNLNLKADPMMDVPAKTEEIIQLAHEVVEGRLGLKLAAVHVNLTQGEFGQQGAILRPTSAGEQPAPNVQPTGDAPADGPVTA